MHISSWSIQQTSKHICKQEQRNITFNWNNTQFDYFYYWQVSRIVDSCFSKRVRDYVQRLVIEIQHHVECLRSKRKKNPLANVDNKVQWYVNVFSLQLEIDIEGIFMRFFEKADYLLCLSHISSDNEFHGIEYILCILHSGNAALEILKTWHTQSPTSSPASCFPVDGFSDFEQSHL